MTVAELIAELQAMPQHAEVRVSMHEIMMSGEGGEWRQPLCLVNDAAPANEVRYEGAFVRVSFA